MPQQKGTCRDTECRNHRSLDSHRRRSRVDLARSARQGGCLGLYRHRAARNRAVPVLSGLSSHWIDDLSDGIEKAVARWVDRRSSGEGIAALQCTDGALQTVLRDERIEACVVTVAEGDDP